jgi:hypothetical protein
MKKLFYFSDLQPIFSLHFFPKGQSNAFGQTKDCKARYNPIKTKPIPLQNGAV